MKHKSVKALIREQFDVVDPIYVTFLSYIDNVWEFEAVWHSDEGDFRHQCNLKIPQLICQTQDTSKE